LALTCRTVVDIDYPAISLKLDAHHAAGIGSLILDFYLLSQCHLSSTERRENLRRRLAGASYASQIYTDVLHAAGQHAYGQ